MKSTKLFRLLILFVLINIMPTGSLFSQSAWISEVLEYKPAPGQFTDNTNTVESLKNTIVGGNDGGLVSLGAFGGNVVFKFDHKINNVVGFDLAIYGNSFVANSQGHDLGSCEPGIVYVSQDLNSNGVHDSDETWYELAGSEYYKPTTKHNYKVTYFRPSVGEDTHLIKYRIEYNGVTTDTVLDLTVIKSFHPQHMYPDWYDTSITFEGTIIESNTVIYGGLYSNAPYDWGYVDNRGYENKSGDLQGADVFDISWAVDSLGKKIDLKYIDFVKVQTATQEVAGWLGDRSTEILGAADYSMLNTAAPLSALSVDNGRFAIYPNPTSNSFNIKSNSLIKEINIYSLSGGLVKTIKVSRTKNVFVEVADLVKGIYLIRIIDVNDNSFVKKLSVI